MEWLGLGSMSRVLMSRTVARFRLGVVSHGVGVLSCRRHTFYSACDYCSGVVGQHETLFHSEPKLCMRLKRTQLIN